MHPRSLFPPAALLLLGLAVFSCQKNRSEATMQKPAAEPTPAYAPGEAAKSRSAGESGMAKSAPDYAADEAAMVESAPAPTENLSPAQMSSSAAVAGRWDALKKLVRRAELRFRTPDVLRATLAIEDIVRQNGGFVLENNLVQASDQQGFTPISRDSSVETTLLNVQNNLTFRVPYAQLDTTLRAIGHWVDQLDYRRIHAEDVSLRNLEEQLAELRYRQHQIQLQEAIAQTGGKLGAIADAREKALASRAAADAARLEQLRLDDAVQLSTVQVELYQRPIIRRERIANQKQIAAWQPGFGSRLSEALLDGWRAVQALILFVMLLWPLALAGLVVGLIVWWHRKNQVAK